MAASAALQRSVVSPTGRHTASLIFLHGSGGCFPPASLPCYPGARSRGSAGVAARWERRQGCCPGEAALLLSDRGAGVAAVSSPPPPARRGPPGSAAEDGAGPVPSDRGALVLRERSAGWARRHGSRRAEGRGAGP